jgi:predicted RNA-binding Zn-ribbon protein involved in translation (DUF1610 family)
MLHHFSQATITSQSVNAGYVWSGYEYVYVNAEIPLLVTIEPLVIDDRPIWETVESAANAFRIWLTVGKLNFMDEQKHGNAIFWLESGAIECPSCDETIEIHASSQEWGSAYHCDMCDYSWNGK